MDDLPRRFAVKMVAMAFAAIVTGLLLMALGSTHGALLAGVVACGLALARWEYWRWNAKRRR